MVDITTAEEVLVLSEETRISRCTVTSILYYFGQVAINACVSGKNFNETHTFSCKLGRFISQRHDEIRNVSGEFLTEICHKVTLEPTLTPLSGERIRRMKETTP